MLGFIYSIIAVGFNLVYGVMKVINVAHGELYMIGGFITYSVATVVTTPLVGLLVSVLSCFGIGYLIEAFLTSRLRRKSGEYFTTNTILLTMGLSVIFQNVLLMIYKSDLRKPASSLTGSLDLLIFKLSYDQLLILVSSAAILVLVWFFLNKTVLGTATRAVSQNQDAAKLAGVNINKVNRISFGLSTALAAAAGSLLSYIFFVYPQMGAGMTTRAFSITIIGGLGSITGGILGGFIFALIEGLAGLFLPPAYKLTIVLIFAIVMLIIRPKGLLGV